MADIILQNIDFTINKGFSNRGNTCFYNSTLQPIFKCNDLIIALQKYDGENKLLKYLKITIEDYYLKPNVDTIGPVLLLRSYREMNVNYMGGTQDCARECLTYFLDNFDMATEKEGINIKPLFDCNLVSHLKCTKCNYESEMNVSEKLIVLPIMSADISKLYNNYDDAMADFLSEEILTDDNKLECEKCNSVVNDLLMPTNYAQIENDSPVVKSPKIKVDAKKSLVIKGTPKYLFIALKRFINDYIKEKNQIKTSKFNHDVLMPTNININGVDYVIKGSIHHMGGLNGGHYIYFHKFGGTWTLFDDDTIVPDRTDDFITTKGYIYLYERV